MNGMNNVKTLHRIINPERLEAPPNAIFAIAPRERNFKIDEVLKQPEPHVDCELQMFVRLGALSDGLQGMIREEMKGLGGIDKACLHKDTLAEHAGTLEEIRKES